ncbi:MAG: invasion associated locus B family protein [Pseudomonadota bacterium]
MIKANLALIMTTLAIGGTAGQAAAQSQQPGTTVKEKHGAWEIRCSTQNTDACAMAQTGNNASGQPVLQALIRKTPGLKGPNNEEIAAVMEVVTPIGVLIPAGVTVKIDGKEVGRGGYRYCSPQACVVQEPIQDQFVDQLKKGSGATLTIISAGNGETADVPISLSGFTKAYNGL